MFIIGTIFVVCFVIASLTAWMLSGPPFYVPDGDTLDLKQQAKLAIHPEFIDAPPKPLRPRAPSAPAPQSQREPIVFTRCVQRVNGFQALHLPK